MATDTTTSEKKSVLESNEEPLKKSNDDNSKLKDSDEIDVDSLRSNLIKADNEAKESYDKMLRIKAEFENYKKRSNKEIIDFRKFALESVMKDLLIIVDNLERAISATNEKEETNTKAITEGINLTLSEMIKILEKYKVNSINSVGKKFDPKIHQAISQEETSECPSNIITKELLKGYLIHDRILRPAMVIVSKNNNKKQKKL